jgi:hypothetical protein
VPRNDRPRDGNAAKLPRERALAVFVSAFICFEIVVLYPFLLVHLLCCSTDTAIRMQSAFAIRDTSTTGRSCESFSVLPVAVAAPPRACVLGLRVTRSWLPRSKCWNYCNAGTTCSGNGECPLPRPMAHGGGHSGCFVCPAGYCVPNMNGNFGICQCSSGYSGYEGISGQTNYRACYVCADPNSTALLAGSLRCGFATRGCLAD